MVATFSRLLCDAMVMSPDIYSSHPSPIAYKELISQLFFSKDFDVQITFLKLG